VLVRVRKATGSAVAGITLFGVVLLASGSTSLGVGARAAAAAPRPARLPLDFVANRGQWSQDVRYAARRGPLSATFGRHSFALGLPGGRVTLQFDRARHGSRLVGVGSRSARYSFFIGSDPTRWRSNVRASSSLSSYTIQTDDSSTFSAPLVATQTVTVSQFTTSTLPTTRMWWRVRANDSSGTPGAWSGSRGFEVN